MKFSRILLSSLAALCIAASVAMATQVRVSPTSATVSIGATQQFTAWASGGRSVTWDVNGIIGGNATVGTITPDGLYTAPSILPSPSTVTVTATSNPPGAPASDSASVAILSNVTVSVSPSSASVPTGQTQQFTATVTGTPNTSVTWAVNGIVGGNSTVGTVSSGGLYTAPAAIPSPSTVTVTATSVVDTSKSGSASASIVPALTITTTSLPNGTVGTAYSATLAATGGTPPYTWTLAVGSLPTGLTLSTSGTISGTPTAAGSYSFTVRVTDSAAQQASQGLSVSIASPLSITTTSLPNGTVGTAYSTTLSATGGTPPYTWTLAVGSLPTGLTLSTSGTISGTPTAAGSYSFTVRVTDSAAQQASQGLSVSIASPLSITTTSLPNGTVGTAYSTTLSATGGTPPYTWSLAAGSLPAGLTLNASGTIGGTPTAFGSYSFTVRVTDSAAQQASRALSVSIASPLSITTTSLPNGTVGTAYSTTLSAAGGTPPYTWSLVTGSLPAGLTLSSSSGTISGTPTATGSYSFTVRVTDSAAQQASQGLSVSIAAPLTIMTTSLPNGIVGTAYSATLSATGGTPPYTWSLAAGSLPAGLTLNASGTIGGTPTAFGSYSFTVRVTDSAAQQASRALSVSIASPLSITTTSLPNGTVGVAYSATVSASGGTPPYTWSLAAGSLPSGLSLSASSGTISGTPTASGSSSFTIRATDSAAQQASQSFNLLITSASSLAILTNRLHLAYIQQTYSASLTATGGSAPYTWSVTSGALPPGLSLNPTGGQISGTPTQGGTFSVTITVRDASSATASKSFSLQVFEQPLDQYGGLVNKPCPAGPRPHFYTAKLGSRWFLCTPRGNAFWMLGVYQVNWPGSTDYQGVNTQQMLLTKYGDTNVTWGPQLNRRLKAWGFNATAEYSSIYVQPVSNLSGWPPPNPVPMPFTALVWPDYYSLTNSGNYASGPVKELVRATKPTVYTGYRAYSPDLWDPNFAQWIQGALANDPIIKSWYSGSNNDYFIGFNVDDLDLLQGFGAGPDYPTLANGLSVPGRVQPHLSWLILITPPTQTSNPEFGVTYTDTTVYSKQELSNWLSARYSSNIASLNAAWGSNYTTFGSNGGWGTGTGLLDEDGIHSWVPTDYVNLNGATAGMKQDLDDFLFHHAQKYFSLVKAALQARAPGLLYLGPTTLGGWGAPPRRQVLQAASLYVDVLMVPSIPPGCSNCGANDDQGRIDFITQYAGDKPWISWEGFMAQPDSYMSPYPAPDTVRPQSSTQANRGALYQSVVNPLLNAKDTSTGTYHVVGLKRWEFYDNWGEQSNWGLVTRRDDPYDGISATTSPGADSWGYPTGCVATYGCEQTNYGDFIGAVLNANLNALRTLVTGP